MKKVLKKNIKPKDKKVILYWGENCGICGAGCSCNG